MIRIEQADRGVFGDCLLTLWMRKVRKNSKTIGTTFGWGPEMVVEAHIAGAGALALDVVRCGEEPADLERRSGGEDLPARRRSAESLSANRKVRSADETIE